jgi:hypothetical protein
LVPLRAQAHYGSKRELLSSGLMSGSADCGHAIALGYVREVPTAESTPVASAHLVNAVTTEITWVPQKSRSQFLRRSVRFAI